MYAVWIASLALTALSSQHAGLDNDMVAGPRTEQSTVRAACSGFERKAEQLGWGKLTPVASLPDGKMERLVILKIDGCPAREAVKGGRVYLIQGETVYLTAVSPRSGGKTNR